MKKLIRILGISFAVFLGILLIFYLVVRVKFPPDRIRQLAEKLAAEQLDRHLEIGSVGISPLSGIEIEKVTLRDSLSRHSAPFFRVKAIRFHYRFFSIFKKRIEIKKIVIDSPQLFVRRTRDGRWNFSDLLEQAAPSHAAKRPKRTKPPHIPGFVNGISFRLQQFALKSARLKANVQDSLGTLQLALGPVSLFLRNFKIPGLNPETVLQTVSFDFQVDSPDGKLRANVNLNKPITAGTLALKSLAVEENWAVHFRAQKEGIADSLSKNRPNEMALTLQSRLYPARLQLAILQNDSLFSFSNQLPSLRFGFSGKVFGEAARFDFPTMRFSLGNFLSARWRVTGDSLLSTPALGIRFAQGQLDFSKLLAYLKGLDFERPAPLSEVYLKGLADFSDLSFYVRTDSLHTRVRVEGNPALKQVSAFYPPLKVTLKELSAGLNFSAQARDSVFTGGKVRAQFALHTFRAAPAESLAVSAKGVQGEFSTRLGRNGVPRTLQVLFSADSLLGGSLSSFSNYQVAPIPSLAALKIQDFSGTTELRIQNLDVNPLLTGSARGHLNIGLLASANYGMNAFVQMQVHSSDLQYLYGKNLFESLPKIQFEGKGNLRSTPGFGEIDVDQFQLRLNDLLHATASAKAFPLKQKAEAVLQNLRVDLSKIRPFLPSDLQETFQLADWNGTLTLKAQSEVHMNPKNDSLEITTHGKMAVSLPYFINNEWLLNADGVQVNAEFSGSPLLLRTQFSGGAKEFMLKDVLAHPLHRTQFAGQAELADLNAIRLSAFDLNQPDLRFTLHASGRVDSLSDVFPHLRVGGFFGLDLPTSTPVLVDVALAGKMGGTFQVRSQETEPKIVTIGGEIALKGLQVEEAKTVQADGIRGKIPFQIAVNLENSLLVPSPQKESLSFPFYEIFQPYYFEEDSLFRQITVDTIHVLNYRITDFQSDIRIRDGVILLPKTQMNLYDGNIVSQIWLNLGTGALDDIAYAISAQVARVNSAKFPGSRGKKREKSLIAASVHFQGKGLDITKGLDIQGGVEVTQMGPQTTDNLLRSLDPKGVDKSIQQVRQLIRFGSKPGIISFQIRHGNLYPRIQLIQPWYLPFKISGGQVALSRIPLSFVLNLALQSAEPVF